MANNVSRQPLRLAVCIVTRVPVPGRTKTRMMPELSPQQCAALHSAILHDACRACLDSGLEVFAAHTAEDDIEPLRTLLDSRVQLFTQVEGSLNDRLNDIARYFTDRGYDGYLITSSDSPELSAAIIKKAAQALGQAQVVFSPSPDGGFGLVGARGVIPSLFSLERYSHNQVLTHTCQNLDQAGVSYCLVDELYDLDTYEDVQLFYQRMLSGQVKGAFYTREFMWELFLAQRPQPAFSVVIPVYNEAARMQSLQKMLHDIAPEAEIIFVDGKSTDQTLLLVESCFRVLQSEKGRARQLNVGARAACGENILFLHADSILPDGALEQMRQVLQTHSAGCFGIQFDKKHPVLWLCKLMSNQRVAVRNIAYGDQGIFIKREAFFELGGFPEQPLMEDWEFSHALKKNGIKIGLTKKRITTSSRRFGSTSRQMIRTWLAMARLRKSYLRGTPVEQIAKEYADVR